MIRSAKKEDILQILEIISEAKALLKSKNSLQWQDADGYPNYETFMTDLAHNSLYIIEQENTIVGVCSLVRYGEPTYDVIYEGNWLNNDRYYVIHRLAVRKEVYGKKIAKTLMEAMEKIAIEEGIINIRCDTAFENDPMNHLLLHLGYHKCGIIHLNRITNIDKQRVAYQKILQ
ncbi:MAG: GNAT family N-acetyltransferase [Bacilli bacterium]|nr:GNAT family N-acetyltransferase [Bacilli bacterium]